jgi:hypothetical protein
MNDLITEQNWQQIRVQLKKEYSILTEKDLKFERGENEEKIISVLQEKLGKSKAEVSDIIRSYINN